MEPVNTSTASDDDPSGYIKLQWYPGYTVAGASSGSKTYSPSWDERTSGEMAEWARLVNEALEKDEAERLADMARRAELARIEAERWQKAAEEAERRRKEEEALALTEMSNLPTYGMF